MFSTILAGTDGSEVATAAVAHAVELALAVGGRLLIVSAYEPISDLRLREQRIEVPRDLQWIVNPHEDVLATAAGGGGVGPLSGCDQGRDVRATGRCR